MSGDAKRCEACNMVISRGHCSDPRCNTYGIGVVLCDDCAPPVSLLDDATFKAGRWKYSERTVLVLTDGSVDAVRLPRALKAYVEARDTEAALLLRLRAGALDQVVDLAGMFLAASQATDRAARALAEEAVVAFGKAGAK